MAGRLADERGMALAIAIGVMLVLSITVTSVISYTSAGSRSTNVSTAGQKASALAEAGMNNALSVLSSSGTDSTAIRPQPAYAGDTNATVTSYVGGGTATWGAAYTAATRTWTIKSIGSVPNPTGPGASALTRTLYGSAVIAAPPYSFVSLDSSCDKHELVIRSSGQLMVTNGIYTNSCSSGDGFDVFGTGGSISAPEIITVGGWETHAGNNVIVNGVTCPLLDESPPFTTQTPGCPKIAQPILPDPFVNVAAPPLGTPACTSPVYGADASYSPTKPKLGTAIDDTQTTLDYNTAPAGTISLGDLIKIDTEYMLVTAVNGVNLTVVRAANGSAAAVHSSTKEIKYKPITGTEGTAATPGPCTVTSGTVTLSPGTYYGGICIGAADCSGVKCVPSDLYSPVTYSPVRKTTAAMTISQTTLVTDGTTITNNSYIKIDNEWMLVTGGGGTANLTIARAQLNSVAATHSSGRTIYQGVANPAAQVTLAPGTYIMAGGGFHVCGAAALSAPNVMIYNTNDPTNTAGYGAIQQVILNTNGSVSLGPQVTGTWAGMTIFQNRTLSILPGSGCDGRSFDKADISLASMASSGVDGPLGSVSGTIYAAGPKALFSDFVSGKGNLAVITGCILIDGGNATFDFQLAGLFGVGLQLQRQWG